MAEKKDDDLVRLDSIDASFVFDMKYATEDNFLARVLYPSSAAVLRRGTAQKLYMAQKQLKNIGLTLKIWDAYRPHSVQHLFWQALPDERFVANPNKRGSKHSCGCAVDVTLAEIASGTELEMPSAFDDLSVRATRSNPEMTVTARNNMNILTSVMEECGFESLEEEWWHYTDRDYQKYKRVDVALDNFDERK